MFSQFPKILITLVTRLSHYSIFLVLHFIWTGGHGSWRRAKAFFKTMGGMGRRAHIWFCPCDCAIRLVRCLLFHCHTRPTTTSALQRDFMFALVRTTWARVNAQSVSKARRPWTHEKNLNISAASARSLEFAFPARNIAVANNGLLGSQTARTFKFSRIPRWLNLWRRLHVQQSQLMRWFYMLRIICMCL